MTCCDECVQTGIRLRVALFRCIFNDGGFHGALSLSVQLLRSLQMLRCWFAASPLEKVACSYCKMFQHWNSLSSILVDLSFALPCQNCFTEMCMLGCMCNQYSSYSRSIISQCFIVSYCKLTCLQCPSTQLYCSWRSNILTNCQAEILLFQLDGKVWLFPNQILVVYRLISCYNYC